MEVASVMSDCHLTPHSLAKGDPVSATPAIAIWFTDK